jgi:hypothetical protein
MYKKIAAWIGSTTDRIIGFIFSFAGLVTGLIIILIFAFIVTFNSNEPKDRVVVLPVSGGYMITLFYNGGEFGKDRLQREAIRFYQSLSEMDKESKGKIKDLILDPETSTHKVR